MQTFRQFKSIQSNGDGHKSVWRWSGIGEDRNDYQQIFWSVKKDRQGIQTPVRKNNVRKILFIVLFSFLSVSLFSQQHKKVLVVTEGVSDLNNPSFAVGRQLLTLCGHFAAQSTLMAVHDYTPEMTEQYDVIFYTGFNPKNTVPKVFLNDVFKTSKQVVWLSTGFIEFCRDFPVEKQFGFSVAKFDSATEYSTVLYGSKIFGRSEMTTGIIRIADKHKVQVVATIRAKKSSSELPYIVRSANLTYIADSPLSYTDVSDRYLLFADMLHDIVGEDHEEHHTAIVRIEDVDAYEDPNELRDIADLLSAKEIPFLVGVVPFYVDPNTGTRSSLSERPDLVDALKYMVRNGGTIVMHGTTHQYKGTTTVDFEYWDESTNKPIKEQTEADIERKFELGLQEFMRNGLNPLIWETPHYTASRLAYTVAARHFSTACEQRLANEDADFSQYFPYIINKDLYGQTIFPENLGYVPQDKNPEVGENAVRVILNGARTLLNVRDGVAGFFFHPFIRISLLEKIVDGMQEMGYTFLDIKDSPHWVKAKEKTILCGTQQYSLNVNDQYLVESYSDHTGELKEKSISTERMKGRVAKTISLDEGETYKAELTDIRIKEISLLEKTERFATQVWEKTLAPEINWEYPRVAVLWNHFLRGAQFNNQASYISALQSVNITVDTIFVNEPLELSRYNVVIVPSGFVDSLKQTDYDILTSFVSKGGNLVTDSKSELAKEFGIQHLKSMLHVSRVRDKFYSEQSLTWRDPQLVPKFEAEGIDEIFCSDEATELPMVIGRKFGNGKVLFLNSLFDPLSPHGYSLYPYFIQYVQKYFNIRPFIRREALELYFDPGLRHAYSIEQLVALWVKQGVRIIHASGWHQYPKYTYDYERLIRVAHANGILVFAWLEPPQVSQKFWTDHPEWREKNIKGEDVRPSWRYPVALTDARCVDSMVALYTGLLQKYDWDGVNIAELYFEAGQGFKDVNYFTPMHHTAKEEFRRRYGFDLQSVFNDTSQHYWKTNTASRSAVTDFRVHALDGIYERILTSVKIFTEQRPGFQIIVTAMDSYGSPELRENIAVDMDHIIALQKKHNFYLQVEDPENKWSTSPTRYQAIADQYRSEVSHPDHLMLDLNILEFRKTATVTAFPTLTPTGIEGYQLVRSAALGTSRSTIYSEATVPPEDLSLYGNALTTDVTYRYSGNEISVYSPRSFTLSVPKNITEVSIDGSPRMPVRKGNILITAGEHRLGLQSSGSGEFSTSQLELQLLSINANLLSIIHSMRNLDFEYESSQRVLASLNAKPTKVLVDGEEFQTVILPGNDCFTISLPTGKHSVLIFTGDEFAYGVSLTSFWSTYAIAIFGFGAVVLLLMMYVVLKVVKRQSGARNVRKSL
jgi:uncharacterized protein YdaL